MGKDRFKVISGLFLLFMAAVLLLAARKIPGFAAWYTGQVYPLLVGTIGRFFGLFPFSVVEWGFYGLCIFCVVNCVKNHCGIKELASGTLLTAGLLFFLYTINCGINYYAPPFSSMIDLEMKEASEEELYLLCEMLTERVNETAQRLGQEQLDTKGVSAKGIAAMKKLGQKFPVLKGYYPRPKAVSCSWILSVQQLSGIYVPFTVEANYNRDITAYNIPLTVCHELSHLRGFMREDEANFIGYLACIGSDSAYFQYSGYLMGWIYATEALYSISPESYWELRERLCPEAVKDLADNNLFWDQFEGKVAEAANKVNDTYLKINDQADGVKSYGRVVDLMLAYVNYCNMRD